MPFCKKPQNFPPRSDNDFMGKVDIPLEPTHETTEFLELNPRPKPSNLDKLFFFSGEGTHILIRKKNKGNKLCPQKKNIRSDTQTQFECEESEDYGRVAGLPIKYFLIFLDDFRTNSIFKGETYCHS